MVSVEVHRNLLNALPRGGAIRMFGDANQLQPIESIPSLKRKPSMFLEMLEEWNGITLESIHRQANDSDIITNGNRIIAGNMPKRTDDFNLIITKKPVQAVHDFIMDNLHNEIDFGSITNQIITATNIGWVGTMALNASIQQLLQPQDKLHFDIDRHKWVEEPTMRMYVGDKVIFTINNYALEIFNGETGIIKKLEDDGGILIDFGDRESSVPMELEVENKKGTFFINPQKDLDLAYVITTHKSQGSEYQRVCYVMNKSRQWMLNRKNLYTAISRAREHVTIITDSNALARSLAVKGDK
jgi:exodeoxyribonuclease V alpha subunit